MRIHICGICGTFMGSLALLAREAGHSVVGSDQNVYPPMSDLLYEQGIVVSSGYQQQHLNPAPDLAIIGNAMSRGNTEVEFILDQRIPYTSGPQWLGERVLSDKQVLAVAGTHGKTTTASMLAWILEHAGLEPGFLIGGLPENFGISARLGGGQYFVVEADEYDTAFFDKRSKFVHYHPYVQVLNNLEFDHADIFADLDAIKTQFHHLVRIVPSNGSLVVNVDDNNLANVLEQGCWTPVTTFSPDATADWSVENVIAGGESFDVLHRGALVGTLQWDLLGKHNISNALGAMAAAEQVGISPAGAIEALRLFRGVRRRLTALGSFGGIAVYDDFAHHPTAIRMTIQGLRARNPAGRVLIGLEPRSNTMRSGAHGDALMNALLEADHVALLQRPELNWSAPEGRSGNSRITPFASVDALLDGLVAEARPGDQIVFMSNGGFERAPARFTDLLRDLAS